jgi:hypothetical protein
MSVPYVPHHFVDGENLDVEKLNDNLEAISRNTQRSLDARYTYSHLCMDFDGVTDASAEVLRQLAIRRFAADNAAEVFAVELVIYSASGVTWTLASSDTSWPSISLATAGATTEATASSNIPVSITSASSDLTFTLSASGASTITRGYLVVHLRCDRGNQGTSHAGYFPTLLTSATTGIAGALDTELTALAAAVTRDTTNSLDLRAELYMVRNLAAGSNVVFRAPSGARRILGIAAYVVAAATEDVDFDVSGGITNINVNVPGAGVATRDVGVASAGADATQDDDPTDATDDLTLTIADTGAASALLAYAIIWWS